MEQIIKITSAEAFKKYTDLETFAKIREYDTVSQMWEKCIEQYVSLIAISDEKNSYTFKELEKQVSLIRFTINENIKKENARIAILAENSFLFIASFLAITTSGNAALIIPPSLNTDAIAFCCHKYNVTALLHTQKQQEKVESIANSIPTINIETNIKNIAPIKKCSGENECVLMFTSGTTGKSKVAILNNMAVLQGTINGCYGYKDVFNQRYLLILPLFHVFGLIRNLMTSLYTGSHLYICQNQQDMFRDIEKFKPTMFVTVPAVIETGIKLSKLFKRNMFGNDMKTIITGAAAVAPYLVKECADLGINLCPGYGLTESANLISGNPESAKKPESVGLLFPHQEFKVVDGQLYFRGKNRMTCYADSDVENPFDGDWFKTGDLVKFDNDGFLYITGRCKEIIVLSNGENISPAEIEAIFNRLTCVQDSQVYEDITETGEHILALEIVPRADGLVNIPEKDKMQFLKTKLDEVNDSLPSDRRMNKIIIRDKDFERSPSMKIIRYKKF